MSHFQAWSETRVCNEKPPLAAPAHQHPHSYRLLPGVLYLISLLSFSALSFCSLSLCSLSCFLSLLSFSHLCLFPPSVASLPWPLPLPLLLSLLLLWLFLLCPRSMASGVGHYAQRSCGRPCGPSLSEDDQRL